MSVCVCQHMKTHIYRETYRHKTDMHIHICIHECVHIHIWIYMLIYIYAYDHTYICITAHAYIYSADMYMHLHLGRRERYGCMNVRRYGVRTNMYVYMYLIYIYIYNYIYTYTYVCMYMIMCASTPYIVLSGGPFRLPSGPRARGRLLPRPWHQQLRDAVERRSPRHHAGPLHLHGGGARTKFSNHQGTKSSTFFILTK